MTEMLDVSPVAIARAVAALAEGRLVALPTETVYGLAADADQPEAVRAIYTAKGRPADHPVIVHVLGAQALDAWAREVPAAARRLAALFWPGPLTLVLRRQPRAHDGLTGGQDTVALRAPSHPAFQAVLGGLAVAKGDAGVGLAAPSANRFGALSPTRAAHVEAGMAGEPLLAAIVDGGPCSVGIESTIVDLTGETPAVLRPGAIDAEAIAQAIGQPVLEAAPAGAHASPAAPATATPRVPGALARHYAPRTPLELLPRHALAARLNALSGQRLAVLAPAAALLDWPPHVVWRCVAPPGPAAYARQLYGLLHEMDAQKAARLLVVEPPEEAAWRAVRDRLVRASAGFTDDAASARG